MPCSFQSMSRILMCCLIVVAATTTVSPALAQEKNDLGGRQIHRSPDFKLRQTPHAFQTQAKLCFWKDVSGGTAFGKSGFCDANGRLAVGAACRCGQFPGTVIDAPPGSGDAPVVR